MKKIKDRPKKYRMMGLGVMRSEDGGFDVILDGFGQRFSATEYGRMLQVFIYENMRRIMMSDNQMKAWIKRVARE